MVAQVARETSTRFTGLRPLNPTRDLAAVALLLEESFREDLGALHLWSRVPFVREVGAVLLSTAFMPVPPDLLRGFVWEEHGQIVGNVTLTLDDQRTARWMISNVAVAEKFRRRGIARALMSASLAEAQDRHARWVILNVRPHNLGAIELYESLGFETIDTESHFVRTPARARRLSAAPLPIQRLRDHERRAAYELTRAAIGERLRAFRSPPISEFGVRLEDRVAERITDLFIAQSTDRYGYFENDELNALVTLRAQRLGTPHTLDIRVAVPARGRVEEGLVAAALHRLSHFPERDINVRLLTSHRELVEALSGAGFVPTRGLTLMAHELI